MQKNIKLLVIGGIILGVGIVISSISMVGLQGIVTEGGGSGLAAVSSNLDPGQSTKGVIPIKENAAEMQIAIHTEPSGNPMLIEITNKDESFSWKEEFEGSLATKISIQETDRVLDYSITNNGDVNVHLSASLTGGDVFENETVVYGVLFLVGGAITIAGIVVVIIGGISYLKCRKDTAVEQNR